MKPRYVTGMDVDYTDVAFTNCGTQGTQHPTSLGTWGVVNQFNMYDNYYTNLLDSRVGPVDTSLNAFGNWSPGGSGHYTG